LAAGGRKHLHLNLVVDRGAVVALGYLDRAPDGPEALGLLRDGLEAGEHVGDVDSGVFGAGSLRCRNRLGDARVPQELVPLDPGDVGVLHLVSGADVGLGRAGVDKVLIDKALLPGVKPRAIAPLRRRLGAGGRTRRATPICRW
jgi:hypothetical protein